MFENKENDENCEVTSPPKNAEIVTAPSSPVSEQKENDNDEQDEQNSMTDNMTPSPPPYPEGWLTPHYEDRKAKRRKNSLPASHKYALANGR